MVFINRRTIGIPRTVVQEDAILDEQLRTSIDGVTPVAHTRSSLLLRWVKILIGGVGFMFLSIQDGSTLLILVLLTLSYGIGVRERQTLKGHRHGAASFYQFCGTDEVAVGLLQLHTLYDEEVILHVFLILVARGSRHDEACGIKFRIAHALTIEVVVVGT